MTSWNSDDSNSQLRSGTPSESSDLGSDELDPDKVARACSFLNDIRKIRRDQQQDSLESESYLHDPTIDAQGEPPENYPTAPTPLEIGRFKIIRGLGQGGFAKVFLAHDPQLGREVAIKLPTPRAIASADSQERFRREAALAARLSHPAIVPVFESSSIGPINFITYEYCPGQTLASWFESEQKSITAETAARIVARLAEAVQHAHQRGVIHRDLKPGNVLIDESVSATDISQRIRITDFGLAKSEVQQDSLTVEGSALGTPAYMSPEQARGEKSIDAATDIYSLGMILYELLTGVLPHKRENHVGTMRSVESEPTPPPTTFNRALAKDLEAICLKCLNKSPQHRYSGAHELHLDLLAWLENRPIRARHATRLERWWRWSRRNPSLSVSLIFAFLSLAIGLGVSTWKWSESASHLNEIEKQRARAERHFDRTQTLVNELLTKIGDEAEDNRQMAQFLDRIHDKVIDVHRDLIEHESNDDRAQIATLKAFKQIQEIHLAVGNHSQAIQIFRDAEKVFPRLDHNSPLFSPTRQLEIELRCNAAQLFQREFDLDECFVQVDAILDLLNQPESDLDPNFVKIYRALAFQIRGRAHAANSSFQRAVGSLTKSWEIAHSIEETSDNKELVREIISNTCALIPSSYPRLELVDGIEMVSQSAADFKKLIDHQPDDPKLRFQYATLNFSIGMIEYQQNRVAAAVKHFDIALNLINGLLSEFPRRLRYRERQVETYGLLLNCHRRLYNYQQFDEIAQAATRSLALLNEGAFTTEHRLVILSEQAMERVRNRDGAGLESLLRELADVADLYLETIGETYRYHRSMGYVCLAEGHFQQKQKQLTEAISAYREAVRHSKTADSMSQAWDTKPAYFRSIYATPGLIRSLALAGKYTEAIVETDNLDQQSSSFLSSRFVCAEVYGCILLASRESKKSMSEEQRKYVLDQIRRCLNNVFQTGLPRAIEVAESEVFAKLERHETRISELLQSLAEADPAILLNMDRQTAFDLWKEFQFPGRGRRGPNPVSLAIQQTTYSSNYWARHQRLDKALDSWSRLLDDAAPNAAPNGRLHLQAAKQICGTVQRWRAASFPNFGRSSSTTGLLAAKSNPGTGDRHSA